MALVFVFLSYMGFFSKVFCTAEEMEEMILAFDNCIGPYQEMDNHCREFKRRIEDLLQGYIKVSKQVNIYYDDPRFPSNTSRWATAYIVPEEVVDCLSLNNISYVRIPPSKCLSIVFPYRNVLSYGLGARKAFDTMVSTAEKWGISISAPPMEIFEDHTSTIQYILFLSNIEVVHSMCDSPFSVVSMR